MNKRQAKIEALRIASRLCLSCDGCMWDEDDMPEKDTHRILTALDALGWQLDKRADRLDKPRHKFKPGRSVWKGASAR